MFNKFYRLNESRWELPEERDIFKYPNYNKDIYDVKYSKYKFFEERDNEIIDYLKEFYWVNRNKIVTQYDNLEQDYYYYIDFSILTLDELNFYYHTCNTEDYEDYYNFFNYRTYLVRKVIRKHPELNPSDILFRDDKYNFDSKIMYYSNKLSCVIKKYIFEYTNYLGLFYINFDYYCNGLHCDIS